MKRLERTSLFVLRMKIRPRRFNSSEPYDLTLWTGFSCYGSWCLIKHAMDICPQTVLRIYAIFLVYPDIILHNPLFRQKLIGRNTVAISFPRFHPRILIVRDLLQYLSAIHSKCIHNKVYHSLLVIRQGILCSFQKCEPSIIDRIIFEIPEQLIYLWW